MRRLALLIGSPSDPKTPKAGNYLSGVKTDIENIYGFLTSSIGGGWTEKEIITFPFNPTFEQVSPSLSACENVDFAFVYFSGHGYTDINKNPRVIFNSDQAPEVKKHLATRAKRQITIIDACRSYPEFIGFAGVPLLEGINFPNPNPIKARAMYEEHISKIQTARVLLFATSEGNASMDYGYDYGGLFSSSLLHVVKDKISRENKPIFNVAEVFKTAQINTQKNEPNQRPEIYISDDRAINLPFAVKPDYKPQQLKTYKKFVRESLNEDIGKVILVSTGIVLAGILIGSLLNDNKN
ncbi:MAG: caspase family protein [Bacteroidales bacterium]|nr:caspase family protein [Bacteroidales bacterium]